MPLRTPFTLYAENEEPKIEYGDISNPKKLGLMGTRSNHGRNNTSIIDKSNENCKLEVS